MNVKASLSHFCIPVIAETQKICHHIDDMHMSNSYKDFVTGLVLGSVGETCVLTCHVGFKLACSQIPLRKKSKPMKTVSVSPLGSEGNVTSSRVK